MEIVDPRVDPKLVPAGSKAIVIAKDQKEFRDLPSIRTPFGQVITRWEPTAEERRAILDGQDIYLTVFVGTGSMVPVRMDVGPIDWTLCPFCGCERGGVHAEWCPWK